jgi:hypothetical protein
MKCDEPMRMFSGGTSCSAVGESFGSSSAISKKQVAICVHEDERRNQALKKARETKTSSASSESPHSEQISSS